MLSWKVPGFSSVWEGGAVHLAVLVIFAPTNKCESEHFCKYYVRRCEVEECGG